MRWPLIHRCIALILASNYFAFQVELFEEEYEANHPRICEGSYYSQPTLTWESFDKQNAPEAFVVDPEIRIEPLFGLQPGSELIPDPDPQLQPVRDKSPPGL